MFDAPIMIEEVICLIRCKLVSFVPNFFSDLNLVSFRSLRDVFSGFVILIHSGFASQVQEFPLFFLLHFNNSWPPSLSLTAFQFRVVLKPSLNRL